MPKKISPAKAPAQPVARPALNYRVRIRMYRHGLGDCFLLSFPKPDGDHAHVLVDCGVVLGTSEPEKVMRQVAENVRATTQGKVQVLVITHEHWDHLSGFDAAQARNIFEQIEFGALWLAWTESEANPAAAKLREDRAKKKKAVQSARQTAQNRGLDGPASRMAALLGFFGVDAGPAGNGGAVNPAGGTAGALAFLKKKCPPTILETGGKPASIPGVDGVRVYVLGPPQAPEALQQTNPYQGEGYGLGGDSLGKGLTDSFQAALDSSDQFGQPFPKSVRRPRNELPARLQAAQAADPGAKPADQAGIDWYELPANQWRNIDDAWLGVGERLALQLDNATNNTSLVLAFEFPASKDVLLFVGDAQAGNWRAWDDCQWAVQEANGEARTVTAADLLQNTIFYKVGHHGSHNATLREKGLERMTSRRLTAMIPVDTDVAHRVKGWTNMPLPAIRTRLEEKCAALFQSDQPARQTGQLPPVRWEDAPEQFEVRRTDPATGKVRTVGTRPLYTDLFL